tara:strand:- start:984 stop:1196 length:213 start_codon:yes stop_codon:yes gene_type:complete
MEKTETGYNIITYDNGVLHFVIGSEYRAKTTNGGVYVRGVLCNVPVYGGVALYTIIQGYQNVDLKTLHYL